MTAPESDEMSTDPTGTGALAGLRVIDLSRVLAGPYCTQMLGDQGAEVIKVEPPTGDETRTWGPPFYADGTSAYFSGLNRNKSNISIDLRDPAGQQILWDLLAGADVIVENFKHNTMEKWGLGYKEISARFPHIIYAKISGFGATGPYASRPGYDAALQAGSGLMSINGEPDQDALRIGVPIVDIVTAVLTFSGILLALRTVAATGKGQFIDSALLDTAVSILHPHSASWLANGVSPVRTGAAHPTVTPYQTFATRTAPIFIGAANNRQFKSLCQVLGHESLAADPRFASNATRVQHRRELINLLAVPIRQWDSEDLAAALLDHTVPASPVNDLGAALTSPEVAARRLIIDSGPYRGIASPIRLSDNPATVRKAPQPRGADTNEVLVSLGYTTTQIAELRSTNVVSSHPQD